MQAVIFDFNGTLFWDTAKHDASWQQLLTAICGREISLEEMALFGIHGRINKTILEHFLARSLSDAEAHAFSEQKEKIYRELCLEDREHFHLATGAPAFLDYLKKNQIPIAIATAAGKSNIDFYTEHFHLTRWFEPNHIIYNDGTVRGKPDPDLYLRALSALNAKPASCLVVEDSPLGTLSAKRAEIGTVFAVCPNSADASVFSDTADAVIPDFTAPALYEWVRR